MTKKELATFNLTKESETNISKLINLLIRIKEKSNVVNTYEDVDYAGYFHREDYLKDIGQEIKEAIIEKSEVDLDNVPYVGNVKIWGDFEDVFIGGHCLSDYVNNIDEFIDVVIGTLDPNYHICQDYYDMQNDSIMDNIHNELRVCDITYDNITYYDRSSMLDYSTHTYKDYIYIMNSDGEVFINEDIDNILREYNLCNYFDSDDLREFFTFKTTEEAVTYMLEILA